MMPPTRIVEVLIKTMMQPELTRLESDWNTIAVEEYRSQSTWIRDTSSLCSRRNSGNVSKYKPQIRCTWLGTFGIGPAKAPLSIPPYHGSGRPSNESKP